MKCFDCNAEVGGCGTMANRGDSLEFVCNGCRTPPRLEAALTAARDAGHEPGIYKRGRVWRVHLDVATSAWEDVESLDAAAAWLEHRLRTEES